MQNFGLIEKFPNERALKAAALYATFSEVLQENKNWYPFLPPPEIQKKDFETYDCVTFSYLNCVEAMIKRKYNLIVNFSDRYTGTVSGTVPFLGNNFQNVADSYGNFGFALENEWPFNASSIEQFYGPIPPAIIEKAKLRKKEYRIISHWIDWGNAGCDPAKLLEALKYGPLQITVYAWGKQVNGVYQRTTAQRNHAVTLYKAVEGQYWCIYDHYQDNIKKLAWNFLIGSAMQHLVYKI